MKNVLFEEKKNLFNELSFKKEIKENNKKNLIGKKTSKKIKKEKKKNYLTPIPINSKKNIIKNNYDKKALDKAQKTAIFLRRIEYSKNMKKENQNKKVIDQEVIENIILIQKWWKTLYLIIILQKNIRGFLSRTKLINGLEKQENFNNMLLDIHNLHKKIMFKRFIKKFIIYNQNLIRKTLFSFFNNWKEINEKFQIIKSINDKQKNKKMEAKFKKKNLQNENKENNIIIENKKKKEELDISKITPRKLKKTLVLCFKKKHQILNKTINNLEENHIYSEENNFIDENYEMMIFKNKKNSVRNLMSCPLNRRIEYEKNFRKSQRSNLIKENETKKTFCDDIDKFCKTVIVSKTKKRIKNKLKENEKNNEIENNKIEDKNKNNYINEEYKKFNNDIINDNKIKIDDKNNNINQVNINKENNIKKIINKKEISKNLSSDNKKIVLNDSKIEKKENKNSLPILVKKNNILQTTIQFQKPTENILELKQKEKFKTEEKENIELLNINEEINNISNFKPPKKIKEIVIENLNLNKDIIKEKEEQKNFETLDYEKILRPHHSLRSIDDNLNYLNQTQINSNNPFNERFIKFSQNPNNKILGYPIPIDQIINYNYIKNKNNNIYLETENNNNQINIHKKTLSSNNLIQYKPPHLGMTFSKKIISNESFSKNNLRNNQNILINSNSNDSINLSTNNTNLNQANNNNNGLCNKIYMRRINICPPKNLNKTYIQHQG